MSDNNPWGSDRFEFPWNKKKSGGQQGPMPKQDPKKSDDSVAKKLGGFTKIPVTVILVVIVGIWLASGFYIVAADQQAVVKRFGKIVNVTSPGPHYHLPYPIETVNKAEVTKIHRIELGYASAYAKKENTNSTFVDVKSESQMLTGDENIVNVHLIVQYQIKDIANYLYKVRDVPAAIKNATQSAIREVAGKEKIDELLTTGKNRLQQEAMDILQKMMDSYNAGVRIVAVQLLDVNPPQEVDASFKDVASAREDKNRFINEAEAYSNQIIPQARGQAETMIQEAEAYKAKIVEEATGDAARFDQILKAYKVAPSVTKKRMYIETMEKAMQETNVRVFDSNIKNLSPFITVDGARKAPAKDAE